MLYGPAGKQAVVYRDGAGTEAAAWLAASKPVQPAIYLAVNKEKKMIYGFFYRLVMRVAHHYNWHYAPPVYPDGDTQLWCQWCGFRQTIKRRQNTNTGVYKV